MKTDRLSRLTLHVLRFAMLFVGLLAATRILYELFFSRLLWLGRPFPALTLAIIIALLIELVESQVTSSPVHPFTRSPLLLNLLYLFNPTVKVSLSWV